MSTPFGRNTSPVGDVRKRSSRCLSQTVHELRKVLLFPYHHWLNQRARVPRRIEGWPILLEGNNIFAKVRHIQRLPPETPFVLRLSSLDSFAPLAGLRKLEVVRSFQV